MRPTAWHWSGNRLYVANQDALVRFEYVVGQTRATAAPVTVAKLPSAINHHWTKSLAADADGRYLYVGIGSNSNIGERGMAVEENRAVVWQVDASSGATRPFATGLSPAPGPAGASPCAGAPRAPSVARRAGCAPAAAARRRRAARTPVPSSLQA